MKWLPIQHPDPIIASLLCAAKETKAYFGDADLAAVLDAKWGPNVFNPVGYGHPVFGLEKKECLYIQF